MIITMYYALITTTAANTYTHLHYIVKVFNWSTEKEGRSSQSQK